MPNDNQIDRKKLLNLIALSRRRQELYLDIIADAAIIAADQVQDKRIEWTEQGPEVKVEQIFMDILLNIALSKKIAGALLEKATEKIFDSIIETRRVAKIEKDRIAFAFNQVRSRIWDRKTKQLNFLNENYEIYRDFAVEIVGVGLDKTKDELKKSINKRKDISEEVGKPGGDSAGVGVTSAILRFSRQQKAAINLLFDYYADEVREGAIDQDEANGLELLLKESLEIPSVLTDWGEIQIQYIILFEACIWAKLLEGKKLFKEVQLGNLGARFDVPTVTRKEPIFEDKMFQYWIYRFPHNGYNGGKGSFYEMANGHDIKAGEALEKYFEALQENMSKYGFVLKLMSQKKDVEKNLNGIMDIINKIKRILNI